MTRRIFVEKKPGFRVEADSLKREFNENLSLGLNELRCINVYDLDGFSDDLLSQCRYTVFGEKVTDTVTDEFALEGKRYLAVEFIPGQFDQRASSAVDCVHLIDPQADVKIRSARLLVFDDDLPESALAAIRHYYINAVESREKDLSRLGFTENADVKPLRRLDGFTEMPEADYPAFRKDWGLAMNDDDLRVVAG
ncbi:MAG: phosphoribosylformylglycinamidine synthase, partial [Bacteroidales bacterium]|nr:phosphoribosylformylglycinamidine synthase [Bacteroidales bacterium]